jgi:hypothetical protein
MCSETLDGGLGHTEPLSKDEIQEQAGQPFLGRRGHIEEARAAAAGSQAGLMSEEKRTARGERAGHGACH